MPSYDAFISYSRSDRDRVAALIERLRGDRFKVWFDDDDIVPGIRLAMQLGEAIDASRHTIACLSDNYLVREWTEYEVSVTHGHDPAGRTGRLIPVVVRDLTVAIPGPLAQLARLDLTDPLGFEKSYRRLADQLWSSAGSTAPTPDAGYASAVAFEHLDDPALALIYSRQATGRLAQQLYRKYLGEVPADSTFDELIDALLMSAVLPKEASMPLAVLQAFGRQAMHADTIAITHRVVTPAIDALRMLTDWMFPERHRQQTWAETWNLLPIENSLSERRIPGSRYVLREPQLCRNSLGPLYPGIDTETQEPVSVNLVTLPESAEQRFFADVSRFKRLDAANVLRPVDAGRLVVDGQRHGLYLVMPPLDGMSAQDLVERAGRLPERAAYELCLRVATALAGFHGARPPLVHGDIKPANILVGAFGTVGVLCIGEQVASAALPQNADGRVDSFHFASPEQRHGQPLTPMTDLHALRTMLIYLLTGAHESPVAQRRPVAEPAATVVAAVAACHDAAECCRVLADALRDMTVGTAGGGDLRSVVTAHMAATERPWFAQPDPLTLVAAFPVVSRLAWPLGDDRVLVWENGSATLAIMRGAELVWRDSGPVAVRRVVTDGTGRRLAVGGWTGAVRHLVDGQPVASTTIDGAVGDLRFHRDDLVVGGWKRALVRVAADGSVRTLVPVHRGVHRIAVSERGDRFTVADQSGGLTSYGGDRPVETLPTIGPIADIAYAGSKLIVLADEALYGVRLDGTRTRSVVTPGAFALGRAVGPGQCLLLVATGDGDPAGPTVQAWHIDEEERRRVAFTLEPGETVLSVCVAGDRLTVSRPGGGCAYRRYGEVVHTWPDAVGAHVSDDGRRIAVSRTGRVELYEDPR